MTVTAEQTLAHLRARHAAAAEAARLRADRLTSLLPQAGALLRSRYGAREVILFGSLASGASSPTSDVDLAVRGLAPASYFPALADLMELFSAPVDLVELESAGESLRDRVAEEGVPL